MRYGVIGPRDFGGKIYENRAYINDVLESYGTLITEIISGGGKGVECLVKSWAEDNQVPYRTILPNIKLHGRNDAFLYRNQSILKESDILILLWDGVNQSSIKPISEAAQNQKIVHIHPLR